MSRQPRDTTKVLVAGAVHLQECNTYSICMGVEKNEVL